MANLQPTEAELELLQDLVTAGGKAFIRRDPWGREFVAIGSWTYQHTDASIQAARVEHLRHACALGFLEIEEPEGAGDVQSATTFTLSERGRRTAQQ